MLKHGVDSQRAIVGAPVIGTVASVRMLAGVDKLLTMAGYYDGPRSGLCTYLGEPYFYESTWEDIANQSDESYAETHDRFMLARADATAVELALEAWAIWERWETEFHRGGVSIDTHPACREDHTRMQEIGSRLNEICKALTWSIYARVVEWKEPAPEGAIRGVLWEKLVMPPPRQLKQIWNVAAEYKYWP